MTSPLCILRSMADLPRAWLLGRPRISGHRYIEQQSEQGQACCVQILKCDGCGDIKVGWGTCICKEVRRTRETTVAAQEKS
jgi:hypothetical protein